ncbi:MAG: hypothetical protein EXS13_09100 [Planctomycetes bacterium]|nr:hypothetical protein [Planctomycetota bacterium]
MLTGKAVYTGDTGEQFEAARNAALGPALARLDAAAGDSVLVALAKHCLAIEPEARPADAGAVAQALKQWHAAQEERASKRSAAAGGSRWRWPRR